MPVEILARTARVHRQAVLQRESDAGTVAAKKLDDEFRRRYRLLDGRAIGSARKWAPAAYRFVPVDIYFIVWRADARRERHRVVVGILPQRMNPRRIVRSLE